MARIAGLFPHAIAAVKEGYTATQFYNMLKQAGEAARSADVYKLFALAKLADVKVKDNLFAPLGSVPTSSELAPWVVKRGSGVNQRIIIAYRDRATKTLVHTYYTVSSPYGVTREAAIAQAVDAYRSKAEAYAQDLVAAAHIAAYQLVQYSPA